MLDLRPEPLPHQADPRRQALKVIFDETSELPPGLGPESADQPEVKVGFSVANGILLSEAMHECYDECKWALIEQVSALADLLTSIVLIASAGRLLYHSCLRAVRRKPFCRSKNRQILVSIGLCCSKYPSSGLALPTVSLAPILRSRIAGAHGRGGRRSRGRGRGGMSDVRHEF